VNHIVVDGAVKIGVGIGSISFGGTASAAISVTGLREAALGVAISAQGVGTGVVDNKHLQR
jgi:hypothetical protein